MSYFNPQLFASSSKLIYSIVDIKSKESGQENQFYYHNMNTYQLCEEWLNIKPILYRSVVILSTQLLTFTFTYSYSNESLTFNFFERSYMHHYTEINFATHL